MKALAAGVVIHDKAPELTAWRTAIHTDLLTQVGLQFVTADCPVRVHATFTMPGPPGREATSHTEKLNPNESGRARVVPSTRPDLDKLGRAVNDALAPTGQHLRLFKDDGRVAELLLHKTFAAPEHVHDWALPVPGIVVRICPADTSVECPPLDLTRPGRLPAEAVELLPPALAKRYREGTR